MPSSREYLSYIMEQLAPLDIAQWTRPTGGYFISFNTLPGCARAVVTMCAEYGVKFTPAGATFPGGYDPDDRNIRIAPSFAELSDAETAVTVLALCTRIVSAEKLLRGIQ